MLESFLEFLPVNKSEFLEFMPHYLRQFTSAREGIFLDSIFEIINSEPEKDSAQITAVH